MEIKYVPIVKVTLNANEWQLYDLPNNDLAAHGLNQSFNRIVNEAWLMINEGKTYNEAMMKSIKAFDESAQQYKEFGARDSEPSNVFTNMIDTLFNESLVLYIRSKNGHATALKNKKPF